MLEKGLGIDSCSGFRAIRVRDRAWVLVWILFLVWDGTPDILFLGYRILIDTGFMDTGFFLSNGSSDSFFLA